MLAARRLVSELLIQYAYLPVPARKHVYFPLTVFPLLVPLCCRIFVVGVGFFSLCFLMTSLGGQFSAKRLGDSPFTIRTEGNDMMCVCVCESRFTSLCENAVSLHIVKLYLTIVLLLLYNDVKNEISVP